MHGIDLRLPVPIYTDASGFAGGLVITQFQDPTLADTSAMKAVEVPILYDSYTFPSTRRKYPTYKRELYVKECLTTSSKKKVHGFYNVALDLVSPRISHARPFGLIPASTVFRCR